MTTEEIIEKFGQPGDAKNHVTIVSPFPLRLAWDKGQTVVKITVHKDAADSLGKILQALLDHFGLEKLQELGIDLFAGCFNNRPLRGTEDRYNALMKSGNKTEAAKYLSLHAWSIAVDLDPERNKLDQHKDTAQFAKPEYADMIAIFYKYGWYSLGIEKNYDFMHFQFIKP